VITGASGTAGHDLQRAHGASLAVQREPIEGPERPVPPARNEEGISDVCRFARLRLPGAPASAAAARQFLRTCSSTWDLSNLLADVELALTELVTNAVLHARTPVEVTISLDQDDVEIAVKDGSPALPQPRPRRTDLRVDLDLLLAAEAGVLDGPVDERDPRLHVGAPARSSVGGACCSSRHSPVSGASTPRAQASPSGCASRGRPTRPPGAPARAPPRPCCSHPGAEPSTSPDPPQRPMPRAPGTPRPWTGSRTTATHG